MILIDIDEVKLPRGFFEKVDNVPKFYEWLGTLPTVEAEPIRHGHWIREPNCWYRCSECGSHYPSLADNMGYHYCPNCGTKMNEVQNDKNG